MSNPCRLIVRLAGLVAAGNLILASAPPLEFEPALESLRQHEVPEWFQDAKLGLYMHWGPGSVPGVGDK